jgi:flagellar basal body-associated protein FliL
MRFKGDKKTLIIISIVVLAAIVCFAVFLFLINKQEKGRVKEQDLTGQILREEAEKRRKAEAEAKNKADEQLGELNRLRQQSKYDTNYTKDDIKRQVDELEKLR